jgi:hypothetical protein
VDNRQLHRTLKGMMTEQKIEWESFGPIGITAGERDG